MQICKQDHELISGFGVHWRIRGKQSYGATICGGVDSINECKGRGCCCGGSTTIHRSASIDRSTTKGDGDWDVWLDVATKKRHVIMDIATHLEKGIHIPNPEQFMWIQTKYNYDGHVERMEDWKDISVEED